MTEGPGYPAHNTYIEVLREGGMVAFTCFLLHRLQYFQALPDTIRRTARERDAVCGLPLACLTLLCGEELLGA